MKTEEQKMFDILSDNHKTVWEIIDYIDKNGGDYTSDDIKTFLGINEIDEDEYKMCVNNRNLRYFE